ncbi:MAG: hypothetical protein ACLFVU_13400 [Phycisphaerae bacterium]
MTEEKNRPTGLIPQLLSFWLGALVIGGILLGVKMFAGPQTSQADPRRMQETTARLVAAENRLAEIQNTADRLHDALAELRQTGSNIAADRAALARNLQIFRSQVAKYKSDHLDHLPGWQPDGSVDRDDFIRDLVEKTNVVGIRNPEFGEVKFGPYLRRIPRNPLVRGKASTTVLIGEGPAPEDGTSGWWLDAETGTIYANNDNR